MAATKAELLLSAMQMSDPLAGLLPPLSPLDGYYSNLEELQMLLRNAAAGGSLLAASAAEGAELLSGELGEYGGEERAVVEVQVVVGCLVGCLEEERSVVKGEYNSLSRLHTLKRFMCK